MTEDFCVDIRGVTLEYYENEHLYLADGVIVPSISEIVRSVFPSKYAHVDEETLRRASERGTAVHKAIEEYCCTGSAADIPEVRNFRFLERQYEFDVEETECPVLLFDDGVPAAAGRFDLALNMRGKKALADIKTTSTLDKAYLAYQLNFYRQARIDSADEDAGALYGIHLRGETVRRLVGITLMPREQILDVLHNFQKQKNEGENT